MPFVFTCVDRNIVHFCFRVADGRVDCTRRAPSLRIRAAFGNLLGRNPNMCMAVYLKIESCFVRTVCCAAGARRGPPVPETTLCAPEEIAGISDIRLPTNSHRRVKYILL